MYIYYNGVDGKSYEETINGVKHKMRLSVKYTFDHVHPGKMYNGTNHMFNISYEISDITDMTSTTGEVKVLLNVSEAQLLYDDPVKFYEDYISGDKKISKRAYD